MYVIMLQFLFVNIFLDKTSNIVFQYVISRYYLRGKLQIEKSQF